MSKNIMQLSMVILVTILVWTANIHIVLQRRQQTLLNDPHTISQILPSIKQTNATILRQRQRLLDLYQAYLNKRAIGATQVNWLRNTIKPSFIFFNPYNNKDWQLLLTAVDVVPPKLIMAQAAMASNFGSNALMCWGNNPLGILVAKAEFGVRELSVSASLRELNWLTPNDIQYARYFTIQRAMADYIWMLNTLPQYAQFRQLRAERRQQHLSILNWNDDKLLSLTKPSQLATDSLYGSATLPLYKSINNPYYFNGAIYHYNCSS